MKNAAEPKSQLSFGARQQIRMWDSVKIVRLTKAAMRTKRHSAVWMRASRLGIGKPGKDN